jgi:Peptidase family M28
MRFPLILGAALCVAANSAAQTSPFVSDRLFRDLVNEISGDRGYETVRHLTHYHRTDGSRDFFAAAEWMRASAAAAGLEDVRLVRQKWSGHSWSCRSGDAWLVEPELLRLASYAEVAVSIADQSRSAHLTAELVDVGEGIREADYAGRDVKGRIVLATGGTGKVMQEAVWKRGALGILSHATNRDSPPDYPDQVAWGRLPYEAKDVPGVKDGTPSTFAVMISPRRGRRLAKLLASSEAPLKVKVDIETEYPPEGEQAFVEAWIRGSEVHDQQIVLTAHLQEEMTSANDDGSGCASILEIGRALTQLIKEGKIPRPRRDIRLWWTNELDSEPQYFRENPGEPRRMLLSIQQDMVAARQSLGGRVQYGARLPWSLPHALEDVMESVLGMVRDGNTSLLTTRGTKLPPLFTREILAVKGSREPYHARMVPYFGHSDHHAFANARVGVPATALINWPDDWIHSTGDDLETIDATQLERNAVVVAAVSLYFAGAGEEEAAALAPYVAARARERLAGNLASAVGGIAEAADKDAAFHTGRNLVHQSYRKEAAAIGSVRSLAGRGRALDAIARNLARLDDAEGRDLEALEKAFGAITGRNPPNVEPSSVERSMMGRVYTPATNLGVYYDAMENVKGVEGLHSVMLFETYNFADGKRNAYDVYQAVAAEAAAAGAWYYGTVSPENVLEALERATKAGAFTVKGR